MKQHEVYCRDITGKHWTVFVESEDHVTIADILEYASLKTFGSYAFGVKENCSDPFPLKQFAITRLPKLALPELMLAVTFKLAKVPTLVIFGCAFVYTVPAINALPT